MTMLIPLFFAFIFVTFQTGCVQVMFGAYMARANEAVSSEVKNLGYLYPPKDADCDIKVLSSKKLEKPHVVIGEVKTNIKREMMITFDETLKEDLEEELRKQGCALGGDIVIIDDIVDQNSDTTGHIQAWSHVIKFK